MQILVIGSGGREHAIILTLLKDNALMANAVSVFATGANAGIIELIGAANCFDIEITNPSAVLALANQLDIELVIIGPEAPLVAGVADLLRANNYLVFGPNQAAAQIEASKAFAKDLMQELGIPTAKALTCSTVAEVQAATAQFGAPYVIKDDGLAAGKGVVVTTELQAALDHAKACFAAGSKVVVEEFLAGEEVSVLCVTDGKTVYPLIAAQDYKRIFDGDNGPNTGGMGAYAPVNWFDDAAQQFVITQIATPVVQQLAKRGPAFVGVLYCGLINTTAGLKVIEFNARFGDPETQVVLSLLASSLTELLYAAASGSLDQLAAPSFKPGGAVAVVLAAAGYPQTVRTDDEIAIEIAPNPDLVVFHAGTRLENGAVKTAGGRVLAVTAVGASIAAARALAYQGVAQVRFAGSQHRSDIAADKGSA
jgi:phosphoribosylamine--glycine ligase